MSRLCEGNMDFVVHNWFYILMLALFVGMHLTGFGCGHRRSRVHKTGAGRQRRRNRDATGWHGTW